MPNPPHSQKNYPPLYVARDRIPAVSSTMAGVEETKGGYGTTTTNDDGGGGDAAAGREEEGRRWTQYLLQRLAVQDGGGGEPRLVLLKQTGDAWDALEMPRPLLIQPPPPLQAAPLKPSVGDFESAATELARMSQETQRHSDGA